jgi:hypothetical protein
MAMSTVELIAYLEERLELDHQAGPGGVLTPVLPKAAREAIRRIMREEHDTRMASNQNGRCDSMKHINQGLRMALRHLAMIYDQAEVS